MLSQTAVADSLAYQRRENKPLISLYVFLSFLIFWQLESTVSFSARSTEEKPAGLHAPEHSLQSITYT